jgi:type II secretory pathway pseudopilin PulG
LLVALAILSVGLTVVLVAFSRGLERGRDDRAEAGARAIAAALLARNLAGPGIGFGEMNGRDGDYAWRVRVQPYGSSDDQAAWESGAGEVQIAVTWRQSHSTRTLTLASLRLVPRNDGR